MSTAEEKLETFVAATRRYLAAERNMHYTAASTAVHGGGIGGAAMTPHCIHTCNSTGDRVTMVDNKPVITRGPHPHQKQWDEWEAARAELGEAFKEIA